MSISPDLLPKSIAPAIGPVRADDEMVLRFGVQPGNEDRHERVRSAILLSIDPIKCENESTAPQSRKNLCALYPSAARFLLIFSAKSEIRSVLPSKGSAKRNRCA